MTERVKVADRIIRDEHRSLSAVLHGMAHLVREIRERGVAPDFKVMPTSFVASDSVSFARMRDLISRGVSVIQAAKEVEPEAERRDKSSAESVVERLRRRYRRWEKEQEPQAKTQE